MFQPPKDPLEVEDTLKTMQPKPLDSEQKKRMIEIANELIGSDRVGAREKKALRIWKVSILAKGFKGIVQQEFQKDFWRWLVGRGKEEDHKKTPWYRDKLTDDIEVSHYVDSFVSKYHMFRVKLQLLSMRRPIGINQTYLFFKYIVRGKEPNQDNFLDDWDIMIKEFDEAGRDGPESSNWQEPRRPGYGPHEVRPWGPKAIEAAKAQNTKEKRLDSYTSNWPKGPEGTNPPEDEHGDPMDEDIEENNLQPRKKRAEETVVEIVDAEVQPSQSETAMVQIVDRLDQLLEKFEQRSRDGSLEAQIDDSKALATETNAEIENLKRRNDELQEQIRTLGVAQQPTGEKEKERDEVEGKILRLTELSDRAAENTLALTDEIRKDRESREKEFNALKDMFGQQALDREKFLSQFDLFMSKSDKRMQDIESNLISGAGAPGPMIEDLGNVANNLQIAADSMKQSNQALLLLEEASKAETHALKAEVLKIAQQNQGRDEFLLEIGKRQEQMNVEAKERNSILLQRIRDMNAALEKQDISGALNKQQEILKGFIQDMPSADVNGLLEFTRAFEEASQRQARASELTQSILKDQLGAYLKHLEQQGTNLRLTAGEVEGLKQQSAYQLKLLTEASGAFQKLRQDQTGLEKLIEQQRERLLHYESASRHIKEKLLTNSEQQESTAEREKNDFNRKQDAIGRDANNLIRELGEYLGVEAMQISDDEDDATEVEPMELEETNAPEKEKEEESVLFEDEPLPPIPTEAEFREQLKQAPTIDRREVQYSIPWNDGTETDVPHYSEEKVEKLDANGKRAYRELIRLEEQFVSVLLYNSFAKPTPEELQTFSNESLKKPVIERKIKFMEAYLKREVIPWTRK